MDAFESYRRYAVLAQLAEHFFDVEEDLSSNLRDRIPGLRPGREAFPRLCLIKRGGPFATAGASAVECYQRRAWGMTGTGDRSSL